MKFKLSMVLVALIFVATSCSGTKSAAKAPKVDPAVGDWAVIIADTPQGDMESTLTIKKAEDGTYTGVMSSDMGSMDLANVAVADGNLTSTFEVQGMEFELKGAFEGETFKGEVIGMGSSFPITGTKSSN